MRDWVSNSNGRQRIDAYIGTDPEKIKVSLDPQKTSVQGIPGTSLQGSQFWCFRAFWWKRDWPKLMCWARVRHTHKDHRETLQHTFKTPHVYQTCLEFALVLSQVFPTPLAGMRLEPQHMARAFHQKRSPSRSERDIRKRHK